MKILFCLVLLSTSALAGEARLLLDGSKWKVGLDGQEKIKNDSHLTIESDEKSATYIYKQKNRDPEVLLKNKDSEGNIFISEYRSPYVGSFFKKSVKISGGQVVSYVECVNKECTAVDESICHSVQKLDGTPDIFGSVRKNNLARSEKLLKSSFQDQDGRIKNYYGKEMTFKQNISADLNVFRHLCMLYPSLTPKPSQAQGTASQAKGE